MFLKKKLEKIFRIFYVVRTGYFITNFVTRLYKCPTLLKPALYIVVQISKKFSRISKKFFQKIPKILRDVTPPTFTIFFQKLKIAKLM